VAGEIGMKIVVTGAAGFVGRALVRRLIGDGHEVVALDVAADSLPEAQALTRLAGDIAEPAVRRRALTGGCDALVHLATVPGGAAEADPAASRRVNIDAMYDLLHEARDAASAPPRVVYASSIAVFGDPLPANGVDDATPFAPKLVYGGHKAMMEIAVSMMSQRGEIDGVTVRLPGILARPQGPSGMKSAFMSDLFHALRAGQPFVCPVSADATIWAESVGCCAANLAHALTMDTHTLPPGRAVTLPALRIRMGDLAAEIAAQTGVDPGLVSYRPDRALEVAFGAQPVLSTPAAEAAGFVRDDDAAMLVRRALAQIAG
jgi:nucleoside-diphosphate-sugar epimerase